MIGGQNIASDCKILSNSRKFDHPLQTDGTAIGGAVTAPLVLGNMGMPMMRFIVILF
jgi:hypothetical protein